MGARQRTWSRAHVEPGGRQVSECGEAPSRAEGLRNTRAGPSRGGTAANPPLRAVGLGGQAPLRNAMLTGLGSQTPLGWRKALGLLPTKKTCASMPTIPGGLQTPQTHIFFRKPVASESGTSVAGAEPRERPSGGAREEPGAVGAGLAGRKHRVVVLGTNPVSDTRQLCDFEEVTRLSVNLLICKRG